jgi:hypothetical protein
MPSACGPQQRDVLCSGTRMFLFSCLLSFAFALDFFVSPGLKTLLDVVTRVYGHSMFSECPPGAAAFTVTFTGLFFIVSAVTSLQYGVGLLAFGRPDGNGLVT